MVFNCHFYRYHHSTTKYQDKTLRSCHPPTIEQNTKLLVDNVFSWNQPLLIPTVLIYSEFITSSHIHPLKMSNNKGTMDYLKSPTLGKNNLSLRNTLRCIPNHLNNLLFDHDSKGSVKHCTFEDHKNIICGKRLFQLNIK